MNDYIATFYSHFGAVRFKSELAKSGIAARTMPVPRQLSSSCGTCVAFTADTCPTDDPHDEIEQIVRKESGGYVVMYQAEHS